MATTPATTPFFDRLAAGDDFDPAGLSDAVLGELDHRIQAFGPGSGEVKRLFKALNHWFGLSPDRSSDSLIKLIEIKKPVRSGISDAKDAPADGWPLAISVSSRFADLPTNLSGTLDSFRVDDLMLRGALRAIGAHDEIAQLRDQAHRARDTAGAASPGDAAGDPSIPPAPIEAGDGPAWMTDPDHALAIDAATAPLESNKPSVFLQVSACISLMASEGSTSRLATDPGLRWVIPVARRRFAQLIAQHPALLHPMLLFASHRFHRGAPLLHLAISQGYPLPSIIHGVPAKALRDLVSHKAFMYAWKAKAPHTSGIKSIDGNTTQGTLSEPTIYQGAALFMESFLAFHEIRSGAALEAASAKRQAAIDAASPLPPPSAFLGMGMFSPSKEMAGTVSHTWSQSGVNFCAAPLAAIRAARKITPSGLLFNDTGIPITATTGPNGDTALLAATLANRANAHRGVVKGLETISSSSPPVDTISRSLATTRLEAKERVAHLQSALVLLGHAPNETRALELLVRHGFPIFDADGHESAPSFASSRIHFALDVPQLTQLLQALIDAGCEPKHLLDRVRIYGDSDGEKRVRCKLAAEIMLNEITMRETIQSELFGAEAASVSTQAPRRRTGPI